MPEPGSAHHYGKFRGVVTDNQDPDNLGRLRARVPRLLGDVETGWALPCLPFGGAAEQGLFLIPEVDAAVWIEFEAGDLAYPIWTGCWWGSDEVPESATPAQKVIKTVGGHVIVLDDDAPSVTITDANGNSITLDDKGIAVEDLNGNKLGLDSNGITLKASTINVGDPATDSLVGFTALQSALNVFATMLQSHTHVGNLGAPTGPPVPPPTLNLTPAQSHHKVEL
jgi:uncharacterized protein involved in type VI secretion and phage assembly